MLCRHTVLDYHKHLDPIAPAPAIFAGCDLLITPGRLATDGMAIGCQYWGRQPACPYYEAPADGPPRFAPGGGFVPLAEPAPEAAPAPSEVPAPAWGREAMRVVALSLSVVAVALIAWAAAFWLAAGDGAGSPGARAAIGIAAGVSVVAHLVALLALRRRSPH
jgi:hypothetical protein